MLAGPDAVVLVKAANLASDDGIGDDQLGGRRRSTRHFLLQLLVTMSAR